MAQQIMIIGLGQFGMSLARTLAERGVEVFAVDVKKNLVEEAETFVTEAVVADASNEQELVQLEPRKRDAVVCAIGNDSRESSIVCTALLRQMGVTRIVARANDPMHQRILKQVGAHEVINPELEFGKRFANRLLFDRVVVDTQIADDLMLTEIRVLPPLIGKTLLELELPRKYGIIVAGIRTGDNRNISRPDPNVPLKADSSMIIVSGEESITRFVEEVNREEVNR